ncbi:pyrimidine dimer DNA glycosylase/endonuclease V [Planctomycetota bacterium]
MRLWILHPRYLDRQGLITLWRESLLTQAVLHTIALPRTFDYGITLSTPA